MTDELTPPRRAGMTESSDRIWRERGLQSAVLAGDESAWRAWYDATFDGLYAFTLWRCGRNRDWADDIVQETWLTAVRRIASFDPDRSSFLNWLRGIAANVLRNRLRADSRRNGRQEPLVAEPAAPLDEVDESDERDRGERVARVLAELPDHYEVVLRAKYVDEQSVAEIAATTRQSPKAVESQLTRARAAFREAYLKLE